MEKNAKFSKPEPAESNLTSREYESGELTETEDEYFTTASENSVSYIDTLLLLKEKWRRQVIIDHNYTTNVFGRDNRVKEVLKIDKPFRQTNCFLKGCKWSPDGLCLLSNSEDNVLRLFEINEQRVTPASDISPALVSREGGIIYDFIWYPKMHSSDPITCVYASTSHYSPIHLWDAYTGALRATYQPINQYDEVTAAYSLAFSPDGSRLYAGFKKFIRIFDTSQPGRVSEERNLKPKGSRMYQTNIISTICINPIMPKVYAVGSYDKSIGFYTEPEGQVQCLLKGQQGGVTQLMFAKNGTQLFSGGRKDPEILCWDLRYLGKIMYVLNRKVNTNQRIHFDCDKRGRLITGSTDGNVIMYDTDELRYPRKIRLEPILTWKAHDDCVNGVSFHPYGPVIATSSGQYHLPTLSANDDNDDDDDDDEDDDDDDDEPKEKKIDNSLKLWYLDLKKKN